MVKVVFGRVLNRFNKLRNIVNQSFGNEQSRPVSVDWFTEQELSSLYRSQPAGDEHVDEQTWRDLDLPAYLRQVGVRASLLGLQALYDKLRGSSTEIDGSMARHLQSETPATLRALLAQAEATRAALRHTRDDITPFLFHHDAIATHRWLDHLWLAPWCLTIIWVLQWALSADPAVSMVATLVYLGLVGYVHIRGFASLHRWRKVRTGLLSMLAAARGFNANGPSGRISVAQALGSPLATSRDEIERLTRQVSGRLYERFAALAEYANLIAMSEFTRLRKSMAMVTGDLPALRRLYRQVADLEATLCFIQHALESERLCVAKRSSRTATLEMHQATNPLFPQCKPVQVHMNDQGVLLSGQNGVGKSTFLRIVGLNLLAARAFGICYADHASVPIVNVWASIENRDSMADSQSLYMAELGRAEHLVKVATRSGQRAFFIIDEIFRGTNNVESVAVASAVLRYLAERSWVVVTSHNIVLAKILHDIYRPLHLHRGKDGAILVVNGLLSETNGIAMMGHYDFPAGLQREAERIGRWYADYILEPDAFPTEVIG